MPFLLATSLVLGCGANDFQPAAPTDPSELYWELALNHHAVTLGLSASYDTLSLVAVPRTLTGQPLADLPTPTYVSQDPTKVVVTPDGVVHAAAATAQPVAVTVTLAARNVKHADTVLVRVVDVADPPVLATFSVQPVPPDSAKIAARFPYMPPLTVHATDDRGQPMSDLLVAFRSSDPSLATIDPVTGFINPLYSGNVTFYASATMFGVAKADSVRYRVGAAIAPSPIAVLPPQPGESRSADFPAITVGVGAVVYWWSGSDQPEFSLEFNEADLPNIAPVTAFAERSRANVIGFCTAYAGDCDGTGTTVMTHLAGRVFTAPGTYDYRCPSCGNDGRIIVTDERQP